MIRGSGYDGYASMETSHGQRVFPENDLYGIEGEEPLLLTPP